MNQHGSTHESGRKYPKEVAVEFVKVTPASWQLRLRFKVCVEGDRVVQENENNDEEIVPRKHSMWVKNTLETSLFSVQRNCNPMVVKAEF